MPTIAIAIIPVLRPIQIRCPAVLVGQVESAPALSNRVAATSRHRFRKHAGEQITEDQGRQMGALG